jgi:hypothetical protein
MVEATLAMPIALLLTLGTVDAALLLWEFNQAGKATDVGARAAALSDPVAIGINRPTYDPLLLGDSCFNRATGSARLKSDGTPSCPSVSTVCTAAAGALTGTCTNGREFDNAAFVAILTELQRAFPRLERHHVQIGYRTTGLGFVGRPGGLPMHVPVSIRCMTHALAFLGPFLGWATPANPCGAGMPAGIPIAAATTTVPTEDLKTN